MEIDEIGDWRRSHYSAEINPKIDGKEVLLMGWVRDIRDLGGIRFIVKISIGAKRSSKNFLSSDLYSKTLTVFFVFCSKALIIFPP